MEKMMVYWDKMMIEEKTQMDGIFFSYAGTDLHHKTSAAHAHRGTELLYVSSGECVIEFDRRESFAGHPGCVFVVPPHVFHERNNLPECRTYYVVFEKNDESLWNVPGMIDTGGDPLAAEWFRALALLNDSYEPDQAAAILSALLLRLEKFERRNRNTEALHPALGRAREYMETHCDEPLAVSELASHAGISQSHLNALFRRETGHGALHALVEIRMRLARRLLLNPYYNISEVAVRCGFPDSGYFTRSFKHFHGVAPGEYRRNPARFTDRPLLPRR